MDADSWSARLFPSARHYQSSAQSRSGTKWDGFDAEMLSGFEEIEMDDDVREEYSCPFCSEFFDIVGLCCHIDDDHPVEARNGVCPVCAMRVGVDMVAHITLQHGNIFKISFEPLTAVCVCLSVNFNTIYSLHLVSGPLILCV
ncbi:hypothetical protein LIER_23042 [Lithospermum erythrorhizon]|uniref:Di19 zinc-binding domain-containing protein n=1 Tax=Lithospermum erythrorhizon TaxID=34254 RepID=A0AAV3QVZ5_LITER